jgi:hypothetical protein
MKKYMPDRRAESRFLCADLVDVEWRDKLGKMRHSSAVLEDISSSGACLQFERPVPLQAVLHVRHAKGELEGRVKYCLFRDIGYFVGLEFAPARRWSREAFVPDHLLDLEKLVTDRANKRRVN